MTKKSAEKYLTAIKNCKTRHLTCEAISHYVGIYPEIVAQELTFFDPMIQMDPDFELRNLIPAIEEFLKQFVKEEAPKPEPVPTFKLEAKKYKSVGDFVYQKMTINGLVDRSVRLSENDLKILKVLIQNELDKR